MLTTFLLILSYVAAVICVFMIAVLTRAENEYNSKGSLTRVMDDFRGVRRTFHHGRFIIGLILSVCYIIAYYISK